LKGHHSGNQTICKIYSSDKMVLPWNFLSLFFQDCIGLLH